MKDDIILQVENLHTGFLVDNVPGACLALSERAAAVRA